MKFLVALAFLLMPLFAVAQTPVPLQVPDVSTYNGGATYRCSYTTCPVNWSNRNDLIVTGFTPDGNYLNVFVKGWVAVGIGRGYNYYRWCGTMQFDLTGNLTNVSIVSVKNSYPPCPAEPDAGTTFTNAGGYEGYTTPVYSSGGYFLGFDPNLTSP